MKLKKKKKICKDSQNQNFKPVVVGSLRSSTYPTMPPALVVSAG
jgi:hypothetical protein